MRAREEIGTRSPEPRGDPRSLERGASSPRCELQERLAKLAGGVAVIKVGATTEIEMKEKKAAPYAKALFALAKERNQTELVVRELGDVAATFESVAELRDFARALDSARRPR